MAIYCLNQFFSLNELFDIRKKVFPSPVYFWIHEFLKIMISALFYHHAITIGTYPYTNIINVPVRSTFHDINTIVPVWIYFIFPYKAWLPSCVKWNCVEETGARKARNCGRAFGASFIRIYVVYNCRISWSVCQLTLDNQQRSRIYFIHEFWFILY